MKRDMHACVTTRALPLLRIDPPWISSLGPLLGGGVLTLIRMLGYHVIPQNGTTHPNLGRYLICFCIQQWSAGDQTVPPTLSQRSPVYVFIMV